jgi:cell division transport system permease protein
MNLIIYFIREMCGNLYRSKLLTTVSVITSGVLLFFLLVLSLVLLNIRHWIGGSDSQPQISVYFDTKLTPQQEIDLIATINSVALPMSSNFVSREESYEIFKNLYGSEMLTAVDENPFPAVLELTFSNESESGKINLLSQKIGDYDGVESVVYSQEWLKQLQNFRNSVSKGLAVFAVIMIVVVFFTITNTIKLSVYAREDMIRNMQYIGASGWYIRTPFVLEGVVQGILGAMIAILALIPVKMLMGNFQFYWGNTQFFAGIIIFGAFLGFFGSFFAVKKFIKI